MSTQETAMITLAEKMILAERNRQAMVEMTAAEFEEEKTAQAAVAFLVDLKTASDRFQQTLMKALVKTIDSVTGFDPGRMKQIMDENPDIMEDYHGVAMDPMSGEVVALGHDGSAVPISETPLAEALTDPDQMPGITEIEGIDLTQTIEPERKLQLDPPARRRGSGLMEGQRVRLLRCTDPHTRLEPGEKGTVMSVDSLGTVHVKWDSGSNLGLVAEAGDSYEVIEED